MSFFWTPEGTPTVDLLYHEAGVPPIHTERAQLEALPDRVKARTRLVHVADRDVPEGAVPGKPRLFETQLALWPTLGIPARTCWSNQAGGDLDDRRPVLEAAGVWTWSTGSGTR